MEFGLPKFFPPGLCRQMMVQPLFFAPASIVKGDLNMNNQISFEYRSSKKDETIFETFLRYTDEKEKSAATLGKILSRTLARQDMTLLDVGSGNGEYLRMALCKVRNMKRVICTLLEPSSALIRQLHWTARRFPRNTVVKIVKSSFEGFATNSRFDIVLVSHVPLVKDNIKILPKVYARMFDLLTPDGSLVVVLRGSDDVNEFRTKFKSRLMGRKYRSLTIDDAERVLRRIAKTSSLRLSKFSAQATLRLPYPHNMLDTVSIAEFFLNKSWEEIPDNIRKAVLAHIQRKKGVLRQIDCFLVARRIHYQKKS